MTLNEQKAEAFATKQTGYFDAMMNVKKAERASRDLAMRESFEAFLAEQVAFITLNGEPKPLASMIATAGVTTPLQLDKPSTPQSYEELLSALNGSTGLTGPTAEEPGTTDTPAS